MLDSADDLNLEAINTNIAEAEVIALYFPLFRKTLIIDTRTNGAAGPMVCVVEMVNTTQERVRTLRRLRPQFSRPDSITMIPWLRRVDTLCTSGVWAHIDARLTLCGGTQGVAEATASLDELRAYERRELRRAITGERYQTLWGRRGKGD